ncbi:MAG: sigma-70 family RNA polymerase sigma factor [Candidatus Eisenbacteria bacterium]|uniref:Sigma-70 family RNA polymerase sigma factor n=1 Tax=Eiseniibacteriota bacterium TaxID=2212470 RepID=A0A956N9D4_UNCEI|nr:sigma-70 family RNA polymerase sigma factor [Candidatus Eisenbacteria bacterium]MCB9464698.1 sigma-70 family RNA polymerase sigma factor [Candidatus Eisenbacteria bacterium]
MSTQPSALPPELPAQESDQQILSRCAQGEREAWGVLVHRYKDLVYSTALRTGLEPADAEDVFQEVFVELYRSAARIRNPRALPRWLMVATRRLCYKLAVRRRRLLPELTTDLVDPSRLPEEEVIAAQSRLALERGLSRIDERCQQLLRALFFEPEPPSYDELSERMGLSRGSIGPIRIRCLERLRRAVEGEGS